MSIPDYPLDVPMYTAAMAGRLVGLRPERVRRWLSGYKFTYATRSDPEVRTHRKEPVIKRSVTDEPFATFLDLVDLLFVKSFLQKGLTLQRLRKALTEAQTIVEGHHFAQRAFFTNGHNIYMQVRPDSDALLELLSGGQWVIAPVIRELAAQIVFEDLSGFAERWFPLGKGTRVVVDPRVAFGAPSVLDRGTTTANVYDLYLGEGRRVEAVSRWMSMQPQEVEAAVEFEERLQAA